MFIFNSYLIDIIKTIIRVKLVIVNYIESVPMWF